MIYHRLPLLEVFPCVEPCQKKVNIDSYCRKKQQILSHIGKRIRIIK